MNLGFAFKLVPLFDEVIDSVGFLLLVPLFEYLNILPIRNTPRLDLSVGRSQLVFEVSDFLRFGGLGVARVFFVLVEVVVDFGVSLLPFFDLRPGSLESEG